MTEINPHGLRMQEEQRRIDALRSRISGINRAFEHIGALADESATSISSLSEFIDRSRDQIETEIRLKSDNAKLSTSVANLSRERDDLSTRLTEREAELLSSQKRTSETRASLDAARDEIVTLRDTGKTVSEEYRLQSAKLVETNSEYADLRDKHADLEARHKSLEEHSVSLQAELDALTKRESEIHQNLAESNALLEEEINRTRKLTNDFEALKRDHADLKGESIDIKSKLEVATQELDYAKTRAEEEQRKHDNQMFSLNSEIENLSSQRRIGAQALQEMTIETKKLKDRNRDLNRRVEESEELLTDIQKQQESDRKELGNASAKLRELNLRYNSTLADLNYEKKQNQKYARNVETLVEENKKLQQYRIKSETYEEQISELKSLIKNYETVLNEYGTGRVSPSFAVADRSLERPTGDAADDKKDDGDSDSVIVNLRD